MATKKEKFEGLIEIVNTYCDEDEAAEYEDFLNKQIEQTIKRNKTSHREPPPETPKHAQDKQRIVEILQSSETALSINDLRQTEDFKTENTQYLSSICRQLAKQGIIQKHEVGKGTRVKKVYTA